MCKKILIISPTPTHPQDAGSRSRLFKLAFTMRNWGHDLSFVLINAEAGADIEAMRAYWKDGLTVVDYTSPPAPRTNRAKRVMWRLRNAFGREIDPQLSVDYWYDTSLDPVIRKLARAHDFDIVIIYYVFFSRALMHFGRRVLKVIDAVDVFGGRYEHMSQKGLQSNWYSTSPGEEKRGLNRADIIMAISEDDQHYFQSLNPQMHTVVQVSHILDVYEPPLRLSKSGKILFVGSANPMNVQSVNYFIEEILPIIREKIPDTELQIVGRVCEQVKDHAGCNKIGQVQVLRPYFQNTEVVVNPMLFGTGISIKTLEALGHARPVVSTVTGARGLEAGFPTAFLQANTSKEFAECTVEILQNQELALRLSENAHKFALDWNRRNLAALEAVIERSHAE